MAHISDTSRFGNHDSQKFHKEKKPIELESEYLQLSISEREKGMEEV